jgi:hypothetical protein
VQPHAAYIRVEYTPGQVAPGMACSLQVKLSASHLGKAPCPVGVLVFIFDFDL